MSFWAGVACGVAAVYAVSIGALIVVIALMRRYRRHIEHLQRAMRRSEQRVIREDVFPEYPTVKFTHVTGIGAYVRGRDG